MHRSSQAQQHIALQKMVLRAGGVNLPGVGTGPTTTAETPTKVLCLTELITADELMDDGEYEEILEDMREEGEKFDIWDFNLGQLRGHDESSPLEMGYGASDAGFMKLINYRVLPDCRNASNPYHQCSDYCFRVIAEAKALMDKNELVFNQKTLYNAYKKRSKNIEIDIEEYNKMKEADPEFYREASSLQYGKAPKVAEDKIERMVKELKDRDEKPEEKVYTSVIKHLNLYDILEPCHHSPTSKEDENANTSLPLSFKQLGVTERPLAVRKRIFGRAWPLRALVRDGIVPMWPQLMENSIVPCIVATLSCKYGGWITASINFPEDTWAILFLILNFS
ncbi:unnamed protein product [Camellia sinensis]